MVVDTSTLQTDNDSIATTARTLSVEETVRRHSRASEKFRREIAKDPEKAKTFLIQAGIVQYKASDPTEVELVPARRPDDPEATSE